MMASVGANGVRRRRWLVHLGLIAVLAVSVLAIAGRGTLWWHVALGLVFVGLVLVHLGQRRRSVTLLWRRLGVAEAWLSRRTSIAWADLWLTFFTMNMVLSGVADLIAGRPVFLPAIGPIPPMRWHASTSLALVVMVVVHVVQRAGRLRVSQIR